jgi:lipoate-protein ligase A
MMDIAEWRLIVTPPSEGAWNMAVDEMLLEGLAVQGSLSILRLYAWEPACLSLGYAQSIADLDETALALHGWTIVRRPTGGRAILHTDELTYSVIAPLKEPRVIGSILDSYRRLSQALLCALQLLGIPARTDKELADITISNKSAPVCFEVPSRYEVTVNGKKLVGSAQARRREGILQHGSLPLYGDLTRITQALAFPDEDSRKVAAERLLTRATTATACLGRLISWHEAAQAFEFAFAETLDIEFRPDEFTSAELHRADQLVAEKYGNPEWNRRF